LQAFNNEEVVRALSQFPFPVVCAIGHDQDVPLAQLVADYAPSTPTACTTLFNESWNKAGDLMRFSESEIFHRLQNRMMETREQIRHSENIFATFIDDVILLSKNINSKFEIAIQKIERQLDLRALQLTNVAGQITAYAQMGIHRMHDQFALLETQLRLRDPRRLLQLGYAIIKRDGKILNSSRKLDLGDNIDVSLSDGTIGATITSIHPHD
jgi:exodeoxyribonuclease VII large subunit